MYRWYKQNSFFRMLFYLFWQDFCISASAFFIFSMTPKIFEDSFSPWSSTLANKFSNFCRYAAHSWSWRCNSSVSSSIFLSLSPYECERIKTSLVLLNFFGMTVVSSIRIEIEKNILFLKLSNHNQKVIPKSIGIL